MYFITRVMWEGIGMSLKECTKCKRELLDMPEEIENIKIILRELYERINANGEGFNLGDYEEGKIWISKQLAKLDGPIKSDALDALLHAVAPIELPEVNKFIKEAKQELISEFVKDLKTIAKYQYGDCEECDKILEKWEKRSK